MTRHKDKRRTFCAPDPLWSAFLRLHGKRNGGRRLRELIARDLTEHGESPVPQEGTGLSDTSDNDTRKKVIR